MDDGRTFDAITLEILWQRLISAVDEASATLIRAAFSTVVRESHDFACVVTDTRGDLVAQAQKSIPAFIGTLPRTVRWMLTHFAPEDLSPGDVLISNNPWYGTGHLPDINVVRPIFMDGAIVGYAAATAHAPDIGGRTGSHELRDVFEEGVQIPPLKLVRSGVVDETFVAMLSANVRAPEAVIGDLWAQLGALDVIEKRVVSVMREHRLTALDGLSDAIQSLTEAAMRKAIAAVPHGTYRHAFSTDEVLGHRVHIEMAITFDGHDCVVDFTGSSPQIDGAAVNCAHVYTYAYTSYGLKLVLLPHVRNNEGVWRPIKVSAPEGSILNHTFPTSGASRAMLGQYLPAGVMQCLAKAVPEKVMGSPGSPVWSFYQSGLDKNGKITADRYFLNGGFGANARMNGANVLSWPSNISNVPVEVVEHLSPYRVLRKSLREGSGGAGKHRGGLGQQFDFEVLGSSELQMRFNAERIATPPAGVVGGEPGAAGEIRINDRPITNTKIAHPVRPGDVVSLRTPGGGGYGTPHRDGGAPARPEPGAEAAE
ncbi:hydantoinase B/oxoprolinase family protein [Acuticoccus kandeliae]|uniref:hydantoinase B/oxoprolinase family protein n=1 Tax=Acuticoccus kandeliae TaxID=2073160 RepID=UPI000D3E6D6A|nr:hydantoinase B/oxoprolinase family protein [Acuticoccus kandeliae]